MGTKDPRVDAYIAKSADFAKPILKHLRTLVHKGCPEVEETLKWSLPTFMYKGILAGMAAFKEHAVFGFWKDELMRSDPNFAAKANEAMGTFGRLTKRSDLPSDAVMLKLVKEAVLLNDKGVKLPSRAPKPKTKLVVPPDLATALAKNKKAGASFGEFSYSNKKEYIAWLNEAKREETRKQRLVTAVAWIAEGKSRNWKYERK